MINLYVLEQERKLHEAERERYLAQSVLLNEAKKLYQRPSTRERLALLLIAAAERIAPAVHESHVGPVSGSTMAGC